MIVTQILIIDNVHQGKELKISILIKGPKIKKNDHFMMLLLPFLTIFRPYKPRRLKGKRAAKLASKSSSSSTSDDDSPDSVSPIPRVRSIEALEFLSQAKQQRMAAMMMMNQQTQQHNLQINTGHQKPQKQQQRNPFSSNHFQLSNCTTSQPRSMVSQNYVLFKSILH